MNRKHLYQIILTFLLATAFASCNNKTLLNEDHTFVNDTWQRFKPEHFDVNVTRPDDCYNFLLTITFDTSRYHQNSLPIILEIESPDHEKRTLFSTLLLRNNNGNWLGSFSETGDLVISQTIRQFYFFNTTGTHSVNLSQRTSKYEIYGIRNLNLTIEKVEVELPE